MRDVPYCCPTHGTFNARQPWGSFRSFVECPECGEKSPTTRTCRKPGDEGAPALQCDVRSPYYSNNLGRVVGSKADVREAHKQLAESGIRPLSAADRKLSVENAWKRSNQAKRDIKWKDDLVAKGEIEFVKGETPNGEVIG